MSIRDILNIDENKCTACGKCVLRCVEGAIKIIDSKAQLTDKYCDGCGACVDHCPEGALEVIRREADEFDEIVEPRSCS